LASFSFQVEEKKRKTIEKKINADKGGNFPSSSHFAFSLLVLASTLPLLPICLKHFFLASYSQTEEKKNNKKKNHRKEKKCKEVRELIFLLSIYI